MSIAPRKGCEIKFQCQSRYVDADTLEETFTNSYVDPFQELNGEFESFDNVRAQSNGIMFDVVALNRNISIRHIELHLIETEYAPVNVSVYATLYNDHNTSLDYNNGQQHGKSILIKVIQEVLSLRCLIHGKNYMKVQMFL